VETRFAIQPAVQVPKGSARLIAFVADAVGTTIQHRPD
jgi:hypothetical protein